MENFKKYEELLAAVINDGEKHGYSPEDIGEILEVAISKNYLLVPAEKIQEEFNARVTARVIIKSFKEGRKLLKLEEQKHRQNVI